MGKMATNREKANAATLLPNRRKPAMTARGALVIVPIASLVILVHLIGGISCLPGKAGYDSLMATAREHVYGHMNRLEAQQPEEPSPLASLEVDIEAIESQTTTKRIYGAAGVDIAIGGTISVGVGGGSGGGGGGGGGG